MKFTPATMAPDESKLDGNAWLLDKLFNLPQVPHKVFVRATKELPPVQFSGLTFAQAYQIIHDEFSSREGCIISERSGNIVYIQSSAI